MPGGERRYRPSASVTSILSHFQDDLTLASFNPILIDEFHVHQLWQWHLMLTKRISRRKNRRLNSVIRSTTLFVAIYFLLVVETRIDKVVEMRIDAAGIAGSHGVSRLWS